VLYVNRTKNTRVGRYIFENCFNSLHRVSDAIPSRYPKSEVKTQDQVVRANISREADRRTRVHLEPPKISKLIIPK
jgi:hypothetical protein